MEQRMKVPTVKKEEIKDQERVPAYWNFIEGTINEVHLVNTQTNRVYKGDPLKFREEFFNV
jgi:hypothetical protein